MRVVELEERESLGALAELHTRYVLEGVREGGLRFVHDKIREVCCLLLGDSTGLHRRAAEAIEEVHHRDPGSVLAALGHHWEMAGEAQKARGYYLPAADAAVKRYAYEEAERLYRAYLGLFREPTPDSVAVRNKLGEEVFDHCGRIAEAEQEHGLALREAQDLGDRAGTCLSLRGLVLYTG